MKKLFMLWFVLCAGNVFAQFFPYTTVDIDVRKSGQFSVEEEHYANTPFFKFIIKDNGSDADLTGWDFALKYGYDRNSSVLYSLSGTNYVTVTNNEVLVNGTTNYFFEARDGYYIALQGTYTNGGASYEHTFAEGRMDVSYTPAADGDVQNLVNGLLTFTHVPITATVTMNGTDYSYSDGGWDLGTITAQATNAVRPGITNDMDGGSITNMSSMQFSGGTGTQGTLSWNADEETVDIIQNGSVLQVGQEFQIHAKNSTGSTITNGTVVMFAGTDGASGNIKVTPATTSDAKLIVGVTTYDIPNGDFGKVTTAGKVRGLDTSDWDAEDILYYAPGGLMTNVAPTTGLLMPIAAVINSHANNGTLLVRVTPINELLINNAESTSNKDQPNGYAGLDENGMISTNAIADITVVFTGGDAF